MRSSETSLVSPIDWSPDSGKGGKELAGVAAFGFTNHDIRLSYGKKIEGLLPLTGTFPWNVKLG